MFPVRMKDSTPPSAPRSGDILIANPHMHGNLFSETLVFLHTHDEEGSLGFILNRPSGQPLASLLNDPHVPKPFHGIPLHYGGPVQDTHFLLALFLCDPETHRFTCELHPDKARVADMSTHPHAYLKAFLGHAGWTPGQLDNEIHQDDWSWTRPDEAMLTSRPEQGLWKLCAQGDNRWKKLRDYLPPHPELN